MMFDLSELRVLVIGGGGFIGQHVVRQLLRCRAAVRVLDVVENKIMAGADGSQRLHWIVGSTEDEAVTANAAQSCGAAIFLANSSLPATANFHLSAEISSHVCSTLRVAEVCDAQGINRFIFSSSGGTVYGIDTVIPLTEESATLPRNGYGVSKLAIEHYLRILGLSRNIRTLSLRISNPYGEGQSAGRGQGFIAAAMERAFSGQPLAIWGDGSTVRDFVYVGDVADAFVRAVAYEGNATVLNVGTGIGYSLMQIKEKVEAVTGRQIRVTLSAGRSIDVKTNILSNAAVQRELGWMPITSIDDGLAQTASWWRNRTGS